MKKIALAIVIVLGLSMTSFADPNGGGLFQHGEEPSTNVYGNREGGLPCLPGHGHPDHQDAPLGSGIAVLLGLGVVYGLNKKHNEK